MPVSRQAILSLLQKCCQTKDVQGGRLAFSLMVVAGLESVGILCDYSIRCFALCGSLFEVNLAFNRTALPSAHSWHAVISAHSYFGENLEAISLYHRMQNKGFEPDKFIYSCVLKACGSIAELNIGRLVHCEVIGNTMEGEKVLQTTVLDMYAKSGSLEDAYHMFNAIPSPDPVLWGAMITGYVQHGLNDMAFNIFKRMLAYNVNPDKVTYLCILKACASTGSIIHGFQLHYLITEAGFEQDLVIGNAVIDMYAKCGDWENAHNVFDCLPHRDTISWGALITGYSQLGNGSECLELFERMNQEGVNLDRVTFACAVKACGKTGAVGDGKCMYDMIVRGGLDSDIIVGNSIIDMFAKCALLYDAEKVFKLLPVRNIVSWNTMIAGHIQHGNEWLALRLFKEMQKDGISPDRVTYVCLFRACASTKLMGLESFIYDMFIQSGVKFDTILGNTLIDVYAKCGKLEDAYKVFTCMPSRDAVTWSAIVAGYAQHVKGFKAFELFEKMKRDSIKPDQPLFLCVLKACTSNFYLQGGRMVHQMVIDNGFDKDVLINNALIDMYAKCGSLDEAHMIFKSLSKRDLISWSVIISGCCQHGLGDTALELFDVMQEENMKPDKITMTSVLKACSLTENLQMGMSLHDQMIRSGFASDVIVGNALVDLYAKCACVEHARRVFERMPHKDIVTWGAMITGYVQRTRHSDALLLFEKMQKMNMEADEVIFACAVKACTASGTIEQGEIVHDLIIRSGYRSDVLTGNALVDMYAKFGKLKDARKLFDSIPHYDVVSWNAMIVGYVQQDRGYLAIELFDKMLQEGRQPDNITYTGVLKACGIVGAIEQGSFVHDYVIRSGLETDLTIGNTLVDMYANCGRLDEACRSFDRLCCRNIVSWNAMLAGYAQLGSFALVNQCYKAMQKDGIKPDSWSYTSILAACSHEGLVEEGRFFFKSMHEDHGLQPRIEHLNCMVELLSSSGRVNEAEKVLQSMPLLPDITGWMTLLGACRAYGSVRLARLCFEKARLIDPNHAAGFVLMSNVYTDAYRSKDVETLLCQRRKVSAWKKPGLAWIEINRKVHEFVVGDSSQPHCDIMHSKLNSLEKYMKLDGFVPQLDMVLEAADS